MIYTIAPFPFVNLAELREKYRFNITPFAAQGAELKKSRKHQHSFSQVCFVLLLNRIILMSYRIESTCVQTDSVKYVFQIILVANCTIGGTTKRKRARGGRSGGRCGGRG